MMSSRRFSSVCGDLIWDETDGGKGRPRGPVGGARSKGKRGGGEDSASVLQGPLSEKRENKAEKKQVFHYCASWTRYSVGAL